MSKSPINDNEVQLLGLLNIGIIVGSGFLFKSADKEDKCRIQEINTGNLINDIKEREKVRDSFTKSLQVNLGKDLKVTNEQGDDITHLEDENGLRVVSGEISIEETSEEETEEIDINMAEEMLKVEIMDTLQFTSWFHNIGRVFGYENQMELYSENIFNNFYEFTKVHSRTKNFDKILKTRENYINLIIGPINSLDSELVSTAKSILESIQDAQFESDIILCLEKIQTFYTEVEDD